MKKLAPKIARYVLGLTFFVFGGAGLFNFIPRHRICPSRFGIYKCNYDYGLFYICT